MSIDLALADAARNCEDKGAQARLTLKGSGVQYEGKLKRDRIIETVIVHLDHGGWVTVARDEIAAVESKP